MEIQRVAGEVVEIQGVGLVPTGITVMVGSRPQNGVRRPAKYRWKATTELYNCSMAGRTCSHVGSTYFSSKLRIKYGTLDLVVAQAKRWVATSWQDCTGGVHHIINVCLKYI